MLMEAMPDYGAESCALDGATGRVLREPLRVDRDLPPYDRVMMDGYAMRSIDLAMSDLFRVKGCAFAGAAMMKLPAEPFACLEVMTGAPMPDGADLVIPVEFTSALADGAVRIEADCVRQPGLHVHRAGSDARIGDLALPSGQWMGAREIGVAASCGAAVLQVARHPRIMIQPTGDELVGIHNVPEVHQIRQSNGHALAAGLARAGFTSELKPVMRDDVEETEFVSLLGGIDLAIFTGAVSKGKKDFLPRMLEGMGCECIFHGVAQRPGKPLGLWRTCDGALVIALPGNPVSALMGLHALIMPALRHAQGLRMPPPRMVALAEFYPGPTGLTRHLPVSWTVDGRVRVAPTGNSGDFMGLLRSDGWITIPADARAAGLYEFHEWL